MMRLVLCLVALCSLSLWALDPNRSLHHYVQRNWSIDDGLPQNTVQALAQTKDGFIWAGTQDGLVRFDGVHFDVFTTASHASLSCDYITALAVDANGDLWVGAEHGLFRFKNGQFESFQASALGDDYIQALETDALGNVWISSFSNGLFRYRDGLFEAIHPATMRAESGGIYDLSLGLDGLWIAHRDGLFLYKDGMLKRFGREEGFEYGTSYTVCQASDRTLWVSTRDGLVTYQNGSFELFPGNKDLSDDVIYSLYEDRQGTMWVGTYKALNRIYHGKVEVEEVVNEAFSVDAVAAILEDREGNLWFGRDHTGLFILKNARFQTYTKSDGLPSDMVNAVFQMQDGSLYAATNEGLAKFVNDRFERVEIEEGVRSAPAISLEEGLAGDLWVGYEDGTIRRIRNGKVTLLDTTEAHFYQRPIFVIKNDGKGRMWIGSVKSIAAMNVDSGKLIMSMDFDKDIHCFLPEEDRLWLGVNGGLGYFENYDFDEYVALPELGTPTVVFLQKDARDHLWAATYGNGLWYREGESWKHISRPEGLFDNKIFSMVPDGRGYYWFSSNRGISRVAERALYAVVDGREATFESRQFGLDDGIVSLECNGGSQPSAIRSQDGRIWFTTTRGTATVQPGFGLLDPVPPPVYVTEVVADGVQMAPQASLTLPFNTKQLAISYTALNFANPKNIRFAYKLEPFDQDWREVDTRRTAYYNNLPSGEYRFQLRAISKDGILGTLEKPIQLNVMQIWWQRSGMLWLLALGLTLVVLATVLWRYRKHREQQQEARRMLNNYAGDLANLRPKLADAEQRLLHLEHRLGLEDLGQQVLNTVSRMLGVVQREVATIERFIKSDRDQGALLKPKKLFLLHRSDAREVFDRQGISLVVELEQFAEAQADNEHRLLREVVNLRDRIHQVSELIEAQQQYAKTGASADAVDVNILVEDAVRLLHDLPAKSDIEVIQDLLPVPPVRVAKTKLLQAVSLLTRESCQRLQTVPPGEKRLLLMITKQDQDGNVLIRIDQRGSEAKDKEELTMARRIGFVEKLVMDMGLTFETQRQEGQWFCTITIPEPLVVREDE